jgi:transcriptional regulator with XRE-family HTH domain
MDHEELPFAGRVCEGLSRSGLTLRGLCREAGLDPSFFSKILSGKRSPPAEEAVLRRIAGLLALDPAELIVSAGRIPSEWRALWKDRALFDDVNRRATQGARRALPPPPVRRPQAPFRRAELSEELL